MPLNLHFRYKINKNNHYNPQKDTEHTRHKKKEEELT